MIPKDKDTIRFAVGEPENPLSLTWRLWTTGNDVYLGAKNGDDCFKISLYDSNEWRIAYVKALNQNDSGADNIVYKWKKPTSVTPEFIHCVSVVIPSRVNHKEILKNKAEDKRIIWINETEIGRCVVFKFYLSWARMKKFDLGTIMQEGDSLIDNIEKQNGEKIWLISRTEVLNEDKFNEIKILSVSDSNNKNSNIIVLTEGSLLIEGQPTIFDISVNK